MRQPTTAHDPLQSTGRLASPEASDGPQTATTPPFWYALWIRSRHEWVVKHELDRLEIEVFLPTVTKWSRWKDRKKRVDWPLFPGYCFARFDLNSRLRVLARAGVVNIVSFDGEPARVPDVEINSIRQLIETDLQYDPCPMLKEGVMVEVVHGSLSGVVGRLVRKGEHARLVLSVEMINQGVSVEVDAADVKPY